MKRIWEGPDDKVLMLRILVLSCLILVCLSCSKVYQAYSGPQLPKDQTALLTLNDPKSYGFKKERTFTVSISTPSGARYTYNIIPYDSGVLNKKSMTLELASGLHSVAVTMNFRQQTKEFRGGIWYKPFQETITVQFLVKAGHRYKMMWDGRKGEPVIRGWIYDETVGIPATQILSLGDKLRSRN